MSENADLMLSSMTPGTITHIDYFRFWSFKAQRPDIAARWEEEVKAMGVDLDAARSIYVDGLTVIGIEVYEMDDGGNVVVAGTEPVTFLVGRME